MLDGDLSCQTNHEWTTVSFGRHLPDERREVEGSAADDDHRCQPLFLSDSDGTACSICSVPISDNFLRTSEDIPPTDFPETKRNPFPESRRFNYRADLLSLY